MRSTTPETLLSAIEQTEPQERNKPVDHVIAELFQFDEAFDSERDRFLARGLSTEFLSLPRAIANELQQRENEWISGRFISPEARKGWRELSPKGYETRDVLMDGLEISFYDEQDLQRALREIAQGRGPEDMLGDIPKLITLSRKNWELSLAGGITEGDIANAETVHSECRDLFAEISIKPDDVRELKESRDKAKTFGEDYLSLIRFYADRIYRTEPENREKFTSRFEYLKNRTYQQKKKAEAAASL